MEEWKEFRWFLGIIIILWMAWFLTGGASRYEADKPYVQKPEKPGDAIVPIGPNW